MKARDYHASQLAKMQPLWEAGMWPALFDAVRYCAAAEIPLPEWVALAVLNLIQDRFHDGSAGGVEGAYGDVKGRLRMDYAHYLRWQALDFIMMMNGVDHLPAGRGRKPAGAISKRKLIEEATAFLNGRRTARVGDGRQIEESYLLVDKSRKLGEKRFAFDDLYFPLEN